MHSNVLASKYGLNRLLDQIKGVVMKMSATSRLQNVVKPLGINININDNLRNNRSGLTSGLIMQ